MATKLADIAQKAEVSQATISRVINGKPGVSQDTRNKVLDALSSMGMAKEQLQRNETRLVALITPDLSNPIFPEFITEFVTLLAQHGLLAVVCTYTPSGASESRFLTMLQNQPIGAAIFLAGVYDTRNTNLSIYRSLSERGIPCAFLNGAPRDMDGLYAGTDDAGAITMALRHLVDLGHTQIGLLMGDRDHYPSILKYQAAQQFFADRQLARDESLNAWTTYGMESGRMAARNLLEQGVTAIACASDQLALGAIRAAKFMGLSVPNDISITGYDDSPEMSTISPSLTTVRQPVGKISRSVVNGILAMMESPKLAKRRDTLYFEPELVVRESTGRCKARE
ncbi:LacI family DNA-binding transcriptional regulator [Bifidobacterium sp.]|jgi:DNA-binding LacI/PurR family transcriptional regulator|uniref:LacI family DNA-binding transcriptional regulator n=1 Tax=Bifidobacterium sp. TaxID=41200 RepID=UPI0025C532DC|nr:LacI family DNA-binding transcriptional regulator [Bifidobacterium sp.]MCH4209628.1 LacI family transcriptional regulator [Bifidobacterium sp.]MCI1224845.1 LacI family transcriptional regulator [Bifidobacterium sp.]